MEHKNADCSAISGLQNPSAELHKERLICIYSRHQVLVSLLRSCQHFETACAILSASEPSSNLPTTQMYLGESKSNPDRMREHPPLPTQNQSGGVTISLKNARFSSHHMASKESRPWMMPPFKKAGDFSCLFVMVDIPTNDD